MSQEDNQQEQLPYQVKNIKRGEKTVTGRVVGRDKVVIPEDEFYQMACLFSTWKDFSDYYGVPQQTLRDNFRDLYTKARQVTKRKLRSKMLETALNGDRVMMIWLSKQWLQMSDSPIESEGEQVLPWNDDPKDED
tara:strand:+ start:79 stop:483 length:405 start_codon:yes stop_codon:yes gene_type:complete